MQKVLSLALGLALVASVGLGLKQVSMAKTETAPYQSLQQEGAIELRHYPALVVAETETTGQREEAANAAFRRLFAYIVGKNVPKTPVAMTTPVLQEKTETKATGVKIAMTTPVTEEDLGGAQKWRMRFVMPEGATLSTLPQPEDEKVSLLEVPERKVLAIRFSGVANDQAFAKHRKQLAVYAEEKGFKLTGEPVAAFYNGPFTLPFLRRNEVLWTLAE